MDNPVCHSARAGLSDPLGFLRDARRDFVASLYPARILFGSNLRARHRRAWLGYLWLILPGIAIAAAFHFLRASEVVSIGPTALPYSLFVLAGMFLWQGFIESLLMPLQQLSAHRHFLSRAPIPHEAVLAAGLVELAMHAAIRLLLLFVALAIGGLAVEPTWLLVPVGTALLMAFGLAVGLFLAPIGLLYDDIGRAITLVAGFALLVTPVLYPAPPGSLLWLNPVAILLHGTRGWLTASQPGVAFYLIGAIGLIGLVLGWLSYRLAKFHLAERLG